jgi:hypothetical protein
MNNNNTPASWHSSKVRLNGYKDLNRWNIRMNNLRKAFYQDKANAAAAAAKANAAAAAAAAKANAAAAAAKANADAAAAKANADADADAPNNFEATSTPTTNSPFWLGTATSPDFKDVIKNTDPKHITLTLNYAGQEIREMFDRRINSFIKLNAYLFNAEYSDDLKIEVQVNPEFMSQDKAREHAEYYAIVIGQLPKALRLRVEKVWIHNGEEPFGGNYYANSLLIHVQQGDKYITDGILEEIIIHEVCHTLFDGLYENDSDWNSNWKKSRNKDNNTYISTYAEEFPEREDIAESFLAYFAFRYRKDRISSKTYDNIKIQIPNRIEFFDSLNLDMSPYTKS